METGSVGPAWRKLFELFSDVCRQEDTGSMLSTVINEIDELIPIDHGIAVNEMREGIPYCTRWPAYAELLIPQFNSHFNTHCPIDYDYDRHILGPAEWKQYQDTEYDTDFNRPLRIGYSVGIGCTDPINGYEIILCLHRSRCDEAFTEEDIRNLLLLRPMLERIYALQRFTDVMKHEQFSALELLPKSELLSRREIEVAQLLLRRIPMKEIAQRLDISPRTVERHALHIYQKLDVSNRRELAHALGNQFFWLSSVNTDLQHHQ